MEKLTDAEITIYEASSRVGGKLKTEEHEGFLIEQGPDCFFSRKKGVLELACELGIEDELVRPKQSEFAMLVGGELHRVPRELINLQSVPQHATSGFAPLAGVELSGTGDLELGADCSIRGLFSARYGREFSRLIAEPLLAGTHAGDPSRLSMRALYPGYLEPRPLSNGPEAVGPAFLSFRKGMQTLVDALANSLTRTRVLIGCPFGGQVADYYLFAVPSTANEAFETLAPDAARLARRIPHRSSTITSLVYRREQIGKPLHLTGFLVPEGEHPTITGATFSSEKWPDRAPQEYASIRVFGRDTEDSLKGILEIDGEPVLKQIGHWENALPQYEVGHLDLVSEIEASLPANVRVAGTSYRGVGIPDAIRQGRDAARKIAEAL